MPDLFAARPDVVVIASGPNASYYPADHVASAIAQTFSRIRAGLPKAKV